MTRIRRSLLVVGLCLVAAAGAAAAADTYTGRVIDHRTRRTTANFTLEITEYADNDALQGLVEALAEGGPEALEDALRGLEAGWIRVGPNIGYPVAVARLIETEEGRIVRALIDRPLQMVEVMRNLRTQDNPFAVVELRLDEKNKGDGTLMAAAKIEFNTEGQIEIEYFGTQPYRLMAVKKRDK